MKKKNLLIFGIISTFIILLCSCTSSNGSAKYDTLCSCTNLSKLGGKIVINDTIKFTGSCFVKDKYDSVETTNYYKNGIKSRIVHRERVKDIYITDRDESFNEEGKTTRIINRKRVNDTTITVKDISFNEEGGNGSGWELNVRANGADPVGHIFYSFVDKYKEYTNGIVSYDYKLDWANISTDEYGYGKSMSCVYVSADGTGQSGYSIIPCESAWQYYSSTDIEKTKDFFECIKSKNLKGFWYKYYPKK